MGSKRRKRKKREWKGKPNDSGGRRGIMIIAI
jgi:hypothetical protein